MLLRKHALLDTFFSKKFSLVVPDEDFKIGGRLKSAFANRKHRELIREPFENTLKICAVNGAGLYLEMYSLMLI